MYLMNALSPTHTITHISQTIHTSIQLNQVAIVQGANIPKNNITSIFISCVEKNTL
jgi:hypothetical protein